MCLLCDISLGKTLMIHALFHLTVKLQWKFFFLEKKAKKEKRGKRWFPGMFRHRSSWITHCVRCLPQLGLNPTHPGCLPGTCKLQNTCMGLALPSELRKSRDKRAKDTGLRLGVITQSWEKYDETEGQERQVLQQLRTMMQCAHHDAPQHPLPLLLQSFWLCQG